jgi:hypothetical protein
MVRLVSLLLGLLSMLAGAHVEASPVPIGACGSTVPPGGTGVVTRDLVCDSGTTAVTVGAGGRLRLRGHVISGGANAVQCQLGCSVWGPGEITGAVDSGIVVVNPGLSGADLPVVIGRVRVHHNGGNGIYGFNRVGSLTLLGVEVDNNLNGVNSTTIGDRITGRNVTVHDNQGVGIYGREIRLLRLALTNNGAGSSPGLLSERGGATLVRSVVTGNAAAAGGMDIATHTRPRLVRTVCGRSFQVPFDGPVPGPDAPTWGVCDSD